MPTGGGSGGGGGSAGAIRAGRAVVELQLLDRTGEGFATLKTGISEVNAGLRAAGTALASGVALGARQSVAAIAPLAALAARSAPQIGRAVVGGLAASAAIAMSGGKTLGQLFGRAAGSETGKLLASGVTAGIARAERLAGSAATRIRPLANAAANRLSPFANRAASLGGRAGGSLAGEARETADSFRRAGRDAREMAEDTGRFIARTGARTLRLATNNIAARTVVDFNRDLYRSVSKTGGEIGNDIRRMAGRVADTRLGRAVGADIRAGAASGAASIRGALDRTPGVSQAGRQMGRQIGRQLAAGIRAAWPEIRRAASEAMAIAGIARRTATGVAGGMLTAARGSLKIGTGLGQIGLGVGASALGGIGAGANRISSAFGSVGGGFVRGGAMTAGVGGLIGAGLGSGILSTLDETSQVSKSAKAFGISGESASGLFGVLGANGAGNARENIESLVTLSSRVRDVMEGTGEESKKLFAGLSVSAEQMAKLPIDEQFFRIHAAIMELPDPMDRVNRLMLAFGEDGGKTLIGTLSQSTDSLRAQAAAMRQSSGDMAVQEAAQRAVATASAGLSRVWQQVASALAPAVATIAEGLSRGTGAAVKFIDNNRSLVVALAAGTAGITAAGIAVVGLGAVLTATGIVFGTIGATVAAFASPLGIAAVGIAALVAHLASVTEIGRDVQTVIGTELGAAFESVAGTASAAWEGVKNAWKTGDLKAIWTISIAGLQVEWAKFGNFLSAVWREFVANFQTGWAAVKSMASEGLGDSQDWLARKLIDGQRSLGIISQSEANQRKGIINSDGEQRRRDAERNLRAEIARIQAEKATADEKARLAGEAAIKAAEAELAAATEAAKYAALRDAFRKAFSGAATPDGKPKPGAVPNPARAQMPTLNEVRGSFGSRNIRGSFAFGSESVEAKQLAEIQKGNQIALENGQKLDEIKKPRVLT